MKRSLFPALLTIWTTLVVFPTALMAGKVDGRFKHASELLSQGDLDGAQRELKAVLQKNSTNMNAKFLFGVTLAKISEQSEKMGDPTRAEAEIREALRIDPDEAYWHSELARVLHSQGNTEEAKKECAQAAQLSPDDSGLAGGCGLCVTQEIWENEAIEDLKPREGSQAPDSLTRPVPVKRPTQPSYTDKARHALLQGTTVLWIVVGVHGDVEQAAVEKPLGLGLDENALRTARTWKFKPATRGGTPIPVRLRVETSFSLF